MSNYPPGAEYDPRAPWNQPDLEKLIVEVSAELSTFVEVEVEGEEDEYGFVPDAEDLKNVVREAIKEKFNVDNDNIILNDMHIWGYGSGSV